MLNAEELDKVKLDSSEEMEFHYFKLHDYDNNNKLDGLELAAAMTHYHESGPDEKHKVSESDQLEYTAPEILFTYPTLTLTLPVH